MKALKYTRARTLKMRHDNKLIDYLMLLRFGSNFKSCNDKPLLNFKTISIITAISASTVSYLIKLG